MPLGHVKPNDALMIELEEVATAASNLITAIRSTNAPLPAAFPDEQLDMMLRRLTALPQGTAEGCWGPLDAARRRLMKVRSDHILTTRRADAAKSDVPPLTRGERIDLRLQTLHTAVGTAIEVYHVELGAEFEPEDEVGIQPAPEVAMDIIATATAGEALARDLDAAAAETRAAAAPTSDRLDAVARAQTSAASESAFASAESRMPDPQAGLLATLSIRLGAAGRAIIDLLEHVRPELDVLSDARQPWLDGAAAQSAGPLQQEISQVAHAVQNVAMGLARVAGNPETPSEQPQAPQTEVDEDTRKAAEARVRESILAGVAPDPADAAIARKLDLSGAEPNPGEDLERQEVPRPDLLRSLTGLRELDLSRTTIADLAPLAGLASLQWLSLNNTQATDLAPLAGLADLQTLWLDNAQATDLAPLAGLAGLQTLSLDNTPATDLAPLAGLAGLQTLYLNGVNVSDWSLVAHVGVVVGRPEDWRNSVS